MRSGLFGIVAVVGTLCSCGGGFEAQAGKQAIQVYHQAMKYGDYGTAIHAMHSLLALDSSNVSYNDSLAVLYFQTHNFSQSIQAAEKVISRERDNRGMLEITARSYQNLGRPDLSLPYFENLHGSTGELKYKYQLAAANFLMQEFNTAKQHAEEIIANTAADSAVVVITVNERQQVVPVGAAAHNLLGSVAFNTGDAETAAQHYAKALEAFPQFILAAENLQKVRTRQN